MIVLAERVPKRPVTGVMYVLPRTCLGDSSRRAIVKPLKMDAARSRLRI